MTRTYAMKRLLEHGELTMKQLVQITGWPYASVEAAVRNLMDTGVVEAITFGPHRNFYRLTA